MNDILEKVKKLYDEASDERRMWHGLYSCGGADNHTVKMYNYFNGKSEAYMEVIKLLEEKDIKHNPYEEIDLKVKCNWCNNIFNESDIIVDEKEAWKEFCPHCGKNGFLMDIGQ